MSNNSTSPRSEILTENEAAKVSPPPPRDVKTDHHGEFRVHVQLLGQEWSQKP
ncbi:hypothetical protein [Asaia sp. VD9]|uniref:hypothetical protein n=1 Tax=Asaia sp. VD9 TaxID=3081235 RepID=UPI00301B4769